MRIYYRHGQYISTTFNRVRREEDIVYIDGRIRKDLDKIVFGEPDEIKAYHDEFGYHIIVEFYDDELSYTFRVELDEGEYIC